MLRQKAYNFVKELCISTVEAEFHPFPPALTPGNGFPDKKRPSPYRREAASIMIGSEIRSISVGVPGTRIQLVHLRLPHRPDVAVEEEHIGPVGVNEVNSLAREICRRRSG